MFKIVQDSIHLTFVCSLKLCKVLYISCFLFIPIISFAQNEATVSSTPELILAKEKKAKSELSTSENSKSNLPNHNLDTLSQRFIEERFLNYSVEEVLDNFHPLIFNQIESTGNFANPNPYTFSILGNSNLWNSYYWEGHRIDNTILSGSALYKPLMRNMSLSIDVFESNLNFDRSPNNYSQSLWIEGNLGSMGGRIPGIDHLLSDIANHQISYLTIVKPVTYRRKTRAAASLFYDFKHQGKRGLSSHHLYFTSGNKLQTTFDYTGLNGAYTEGYTQLMLDGNLPILKRWFSDVKYILSYQERDNLYSEFYYGEEETANYASLASSIFGTSSKSRNHQVTTGFNFSLHSVKHQNPNFTRNLVDQDLEGIEPWYASGQHFQINHALNATKVIDSERGLSLFADLYNSFLLFNPTGNNYQHALYYQPLDSVYQSVEMLELESNAFASALIQNQAGLKWDYTKNKWTAKAKVALVHNGFVLPEQAYQKTSGDFTFSLEKKSKKIIENMALNFGYIHTPFTYNYIQYFSDDYLSGNRFLWQDENANYHAESNELSPKGRFGGSTRSIGSDMKNPAYFYLQVPTTVRIYKGFKFSLILDYRKFNNLWWINYTDELAQNGNWQNLLNEEVFVQTKFEDKQYQSIPFPQEAMKNNTQSESVFFNSPFTGSATFLFQYTSLSRRLYAVFSFNAYMVVGWGSLGNGVLHSNIGILSDAMANPNSFKYSGGRLDSDRSYVARLFVNYTAKKWAFSCQGKYKDGQSFSAVRSIMSDNEFVMWPARVKGDNPFTGEFGSREVYYFQLDLRAKYKTKIKNTPLNFHLTCYNSADFGLEIIQYNFAPITATGRRAMDFQIPRGLLFGLSFEI